VILRAADGPLWRLIGQATPPCDPLEARPTPTVNQMPKLRFAALNNPEYHEVIATSYETDDEVVTLYGVTSFDGKVSPPWPRGVVTEKGGTVLRTRFAGQVEVVG
jgi:hypothetical protein